MFGILRPASVRFTHRPVPTVCLFWTARNMSSTLPRLGQAPLLLSPREVSGLPAGSVVKVDASWYMPNAKRDTFHEFKTRRLPDARYLDLDVVASDHELGLKHMMPSGQVFADFCGEPASVGIDVSAERCV